MSPAAPAERAMLALLILCWLIYHAVAKASEQARVLECDFLSHGQTHSQKQKLNKHKKKKHINKHSDPCS